MEATGRSGLRGKLMARCEQCGNDYDKAFRVIDPQGGEHWYDCFECAITALAPVCGHCQTRIVGHGMEAGDES